MFVCLFVYLIIFAVGFTGIGYCDGGGNWESKRIDLTVSKRGEIVVMWRVVKMVTTAQTEPTALLLIPAMR